MYTDTYILESGNVTSVYQLIDVHVSVSQQSIWRQTPVFSFSSTFSSLSTPSHYSISLKFLRDKSPPDKPPPWQISTLTNLHPDKSPSWQKAWRSPTLTQWCLPVLVSSGVSLRSKTNTIFWQFHHLLLVPSELDKIKAMEKLSSHFINSLGSSHC